MKFLTLAMIIFTSPIALTWEITQITINHLQVTQTNDRFYISVGETEETISGCTQVIGNKNWLGFEIDPNDEAQKAIISMAMAAYMSGAKVDVGSSALGCINGASVAHLGYIRLGNYR